jgi:hypothetical protein
MRQLLPVRLLCISIIISPPLSAQNSIVDTASRNNALKQVTDFYFHSIAENGLVNYGNEVVEYADKSINHPFYTTDKFVSGSMFGYGVIYNDIPLKYDLVHDKLIVLHYNKIFNVEQISERIDRFTVLGHEFVRLVPDSSSQSEVSAGFYDRIYSGNSVSLFAKRKKIAAERMKEGQSEHIFKERNSYYIKKDNFFHPVSDKSSVLKIMSDKRKELEAFLKKNQIKFSKNREYAMAQLSEYYDRLKN